MNFACSLFPILLICFITNVPSSTSSSSSSSSALSSSDVVSSSAMSSSASATAMSSSAMSSSAMSSSASATAMSSSAMSSSEMPSSSVGNCITIDNCGSCFTTANCSWDFAQNFCVEDATFLPYPFNGEVYAATSAFCPFYDCLFDFQNPGYDMLQKVFAMENEANIANFSACLMPESTLPTCDGTMWVSGDPYITMCANITSADKTSTVCDYNNDLTWTVMISGALRRLRNLLSSSSSSSEMSSSAMSSSGMSSSVMSSSAMSSSGMSSSAMSSSGMSSSEMSPSGMSSSEMSSQMPSSSSPKTAAFKQAYCQPTSCTDSFMLTQFPKIFKQEFNFDLNQTAFTQMAGYTCPVAPTPSGGLSGGAIAGIIIGVLVGVLLFGFLGWNMCGKNDTSSKYQKM